MKKIFDLYIEKDEHDPYEIMTCPICWFKKFRTIFFLNRHCIGKAPEPDRLWYASSCRWRPGPMSAAVADRECAALRPASRAGSR